MRVLLAAISLSALGFVFTSDDPADLPTGPSALPAAISGAPDTPPAPATVTYTTEPQVVVQPQHAPATQTPDDKSARVTNMPAGSAIRPSPRTNGLTIPARRPAMRPESFRMIGAQPRPRPEHFPARIARAQLRDTLAGQPERICLAVAIYHEARDQSVAGQMAVAAVVIARAQNPARWGSSICEVIVPVEFSFLTSDGRFGPIDEIEAWVRALEIADAALKEGPPPELANANHYHTRDVKPYWSEQMPRLTVIGDHIFYADPV